MRDVKMYEILDDEREKNDDDFNRDLENEDLEEVLKIEMLGKRF